MYRLLIVDDEPGIVEGLFAIFQDQRQLELDIYKAYSAYEAMEIIKQFRVDILLSDIMMPEMDGFQLLDEVVKLWPECKVVFLTGYDEFDYIYKAIHKHEIKYVLKIESNSVIIKAVEEMLNKLKKENEQKEIIHKANEQVQSMIPSLQKEFVKDMLMGEVIPAELRCQRFNELKIGLKHDLPVFLMMGRVDFWSEETDFMEKNKAFLSVEEILNNYIGMHIANICIVYEGFKLIWLMQPLENCTLKFAGDDGGVDWTAVSVFIKETLDQVQDSCISVYCLPISFVVGSRAVCWEEVSREFAMLKFIFEKELLPENKMMIVDAAQQSRSPMLKSISHSIETSGFKNKVSLIETYMDKGLEDELKTALASLDIDIRYNRLHFMERFHSLMLMLISYVNRHEIGFANERLQSLGDDMNSITPDTVFFFKKQIEDIVVSICRSRNEVKDNISNDIIEHVQNYIKENYGDDLSLVRLAKLVYFNPSYLSRFYKLQTGRNLSDYINEIRMEKAKELIENMQIKIKEVALNVGFMSPSAFTMFFKKYSGTSPQEYRDNIKYKNKNNM